MASQNAASHYPEEKVGQVNHVDEALLDSSKEVPGYDSEYSPEEQKKIIHRVDRRLISTCGKDHSCHEDRPAQSRPGI